MGKNYKKKEKKIIFDLPKLNNILGIDIDLLGIEFNI